MTRRTIVFRDGKKFYASHEFNGDKTEAAGFHPGIGIEADWPEIVELFTGKTTVESFKEAVREAERLYGYESMEVLELDELPSCEEIWMTTGMFLYLYTKYGEPTVSWAADLAKEYGFKADYSKDTVTITAKDTDGRWTAWFSITVMEDGLVRIRGNNTNQCNIWLYQTRPDMTPERCAEFFKRLSDTVGLLGEKGIEMSSWIDPEDWQEIAGVSDAYEDERYTGGKEGGKSVITMEERKDLVHFEHSGVEYAMTQREIEAAYRYQEHQYRLQDAKRQLNIFVFGVDDGSDFDDPEDEQAKDDFAEEYGISYDEAISKPMLEEYLRRFEARFDCNNDENSQWEAAILAVLEDAKVV